jgi:hypothetical protein
MSQRLNKNGIPVLDPPGRNGIRNRPECLPGEHVWGNRRLLQTHPSDWGECDVMEFEVTCKRCGVKDTFFR